MQDYLTERQRRTEINNSFNDFIAFHTGVRQGSILRLLHVNIYNLFLFIEKEIVTSCADDTLRISAQQGSILGPPLLTFCEAFFSIEEENVTSYTDDTTPYFNSNIIVTDLEDIETKTLLLKVVFLENCQKLQLIINQHLTIMSARALVRISNYMSKEKLRIFMNVFLSSQFRYCALVRILHSLTLYNRIDQLQERVLRLIYDDNDFPFRSISKTNNSPSRYPEIYY